MARTLLFTTLISILVFFPLIGLKLDEQMGTLALVPRFGAASLTVLLIVAVHAIILWWKAQPNPPNLPKITLPTSFEKPALLIGTLLILTLPFLPGIDRYIVDVAGLILIYILLAIGLQLVVGQAGLLDLGYVYYYAIGAYGYALLQSTFGISFWGCLPLVMIMAAAASLIPGFPSLRLRGDYFAIVTLGVAEIFRQLLINLPDITGGPNGITQVPRPVLFGLSLDRGDNNLFDALGLGFDPAYRTIALYYIFLFFVLFAFGLVHSLRRRTLFLQLEAMREDELAARAIGLPLIKLKLGIYALAASIGAVAGACFAARQGFISPESFTFMESATILAIVVLAGVGRSLGLWIAAFLVIGLPEMFRDLAEYRMLVFGLGLIAMMIWRPGGIFATRQPLITRGN